MNASIFFGHFLRVVGLLALCVVFATSAGAQTAAGGASHTVILKSDGTVWSVGNNSYGQLGDATNTSQITAAVQVSGLADIVAVAAGANHSMAITSTGTLYLWGHNANGQLGDASTTNRNGPVESNLGSVVAIAAGDSHSVALTSNGDVYTWGRNTNGQLGDGSTTQSTSAVLVVTGAAAVGAGMNHTLFVKTDGTVRASGYNGYGQLGDGTTTQRTSPVQMAGISTATAAAGGGYHSIVLLSDGTLKAAGYNSEGELGDGTSTSRTSPVAVANLTGITAIAVGRFHALARTSDGAIWGWGYGGWGQIGDGSTAIRTTPVAVAAISSIVKIGAGVEHSMAVSSTGEVYTWGRNSASQLGDGTTMNRSTPTAISDAGYQWKVSAPTLSHLSSTYTANINVTVTTATTGATIHYTRDGTEPTESDAIVVSGTSLLVDYSQTLKAKTFKSGSAPSNDAVGAYVMKVATVALSPGAGTYTSARSVSMTTATTGATIRYTTDGSTPTASSTIYSAPISVGTSTQVKATGFKTNWSDSTVTSGVYTMNFGTLAAPAPDQATGTYTNSVTVALSAMPGATIRYTTDATAAQATSPIYTAPLVFDTTKTLRAKAFHPDYVTSAETIRTYTLAAAAPTVDPAAGTYVAGQVVTITAPSAGSTLHYTINGIDPVTTDPTIASGATLVVGNYTLKVKAWKTGANASAVTSATYAITGQVAPPAIAAGDHHALAIRSDGVAWTWGQNSSGQAGNGTTVSPQMMPSMVAGVTGAMALTAGSDFSHVLVTGGSVIGFGGNSNGRLGDGTTTPRPWPTSITGLSGILSVDGGPDHSLALKGDGTVTAWGANAVGQLGDGTTTQRLSPTAVNALTTVTAISAGRYTSLALKQDGTVAAWGSNVYGQLGDGTTTARSTPVTVSSITTATSVAAGGLHSLALLADGTVTAWGNNTYGQLGDGTNIQRTIPVAVALLTNVTAIAAGLDFSLALKDDGTVWATGGNSHGQLGDGTTTARSSIGQVAVLTNIIQIAAGSTFALALDSNARVWAWGYNAYGQLGDGTTINRTTPIQISGDGMNWRVITPTVSLASGQFFTNQSVTVAIADPDATLRYTTTGIDPVDTDAIVASGGAIAIDQSATLKVSGWKTGAPASVVVARTYDLKAVVPAMSPGAGNYAGAQTVTIATTTSGATLRYTVDGTEPTTTATVYAGALTVAETLTLKARAYKTGWTASDSGHASFWISAGTVAAPVITPSGGAQTTPPLVSMTTATTGATLRYTLDGSTPTAASPIFTYPFLVPATTTVMAKAFKAGYTASATTSVTYDVDAAGATATPAIVPVGGRFAVTQTVTVTGPSGATLRYTTDGTDPTTSSTSITSGGTLSVTKSQVLKVRAWAGGLTESAVRRADFMITGAVAAGYNHSVGLTSQGVLWAWGNNGLGQLGDGTGATRVVPVQMLTGVKAAAAGYAFTVAAKNDGTLWVSGTVAALGSHYSPIQVASFSNVISVAGGYRHVLALKSDGTVWGYGDNSQGQLGDGTTTTRTTAVQVIGLTGVVAVAAGRDVSYALQTNDAGVGIIWAWGANTYGQLGDGSTLSRATPTRVTGLAGATQIAIGAMSSTATALAADGRVFTWGKNDNAQLGIGTTGDTSTAVPVSVISNVREIGAGSEYSLAVDATARVWGWGNRSTGALGVGPVISQYDRAWVPERSDLIEALSVSGGDFHTIAAMPDGTVRAFGGTNGGLLGNGQTTFTTDIVVVSGLSLADNAWLTGDADLDDLPTWREYLVGSDPLNADSNGNDILDGHDEASGTDAANPDIDGDGVPNWTERVNGTDPFRADSDGDGVSDSADVFPLDPTRSLPHSPTPSDTTPPIIALKEPVTARPIP